MAFTPAREVAANRLARMGAKLSFFTVGAICPISGANSCHAGGRLLPRAWSSLRCHILAVLCRCTGPVGR